MFSASVILLACAGVTISDTVLATLRASSPSADLLDGLVDRVHADVLQEDLGHRRRDAVRLVAVDEDLHVDAIAGAQQAGRALAGVDRDRSSAACPSGTPWIGSFVWPLASSLPSRIGSPW